MSLKILIVEANREERRTLGELLTKEPAFVAFTLRVIEASNGEEGLDRFIKDRPDFVLTAIRLPKIDGLILCRAIRDLPQGQHTPILLLGSLELLGPNASAVVAELHLEVAASPSHSKAFVSQLLEVLQRYRREHPVESRRWMGMTIETSTVNPARDPRVEAPTSPSPSPPPIPAAGRGAPAEPPSGNRQNQAKAARIDKPGRPFERPSREPSAPPPLRGGAGAGGRLLPDTGPIRPPPPSPPPSPSAADLPKRGTLGDHPPPWLLVRAATRSSTGKLWLMRGKVKKEIFIQAGAPIFVNSNLRSETLGSYLLSRGIIDEAQLTKALERSRGSGVKLGETLVELGFVDEKTVDSGIRAQTRIKIASVIRWQDGEFLFEEGGAFAESVPRFPIEPVGFVLAALKKLVRVEDLPAVMAPQREYRVKLTDAGIRFRATIDRVFGPTIVSKLTAALSLREALFASDSVPEMYLLAEALRLSGLAEFSAPPEAATLSKGAGQPGWAKATPPLGLDLPWLDPRKAASSTPAPASSEESLEIELEERGRDLTFYPEESGIIEVRSPSMSTEIGRSASRPGTASAPRVPAAIEPLPIDLDDGLTPTPPPVADYEIHLVREKEAACREDLQRAIEGLQSKTFYQVLEIDAGASRQEIEHAHRVAAERFSPRRFEGIDLGADRSKLSELRLVIELAWKVLSDDTQRQSYDETLRRGPRRGRPSSALTPVPAGARGEKEPPESIDLEGAATRSSTLDAELAFQEGQQLLRQNDLLGAVTAYRQAAKLNPEQADYHAFLGWALFLSHGRTEVGARAARVHMEQAFRISPDSVEVHELAGHLERAVGNHAAAADHLLRAFSVDPPKLELFDPIKELLTLLGRFEDLERQYRRLIFRFRETDPQRTVPFWIDLAYIYFTRLGRPDRARVALDVASKIAPASPQVQAAMSVIGGSTSDKWQPVAEGHRQRLHNEPTSRDPLHEIFELHRIGNRPDHALAAASILVHLEVATDEERRYFETASPRTFPYAAQPLPAKSLERLRYPSDDPTIEGVMEILSPLVSRLLPVDLKAFGSNEANRLSPASIPQPLSSSLGYASQMLVTQVPKVYLGHTLGPEMIPFPSDEPALLVGRALLDSKDEAQCVFWAARAMSCLTLGRRHVFGRRASDLKVAVLSALSCHKPEMTFPDPDGKIARFQQALLSREIDLGRLAGLLDAVLAMETQLNLSEWMRGVRRTSARLGALVGSNLRVALDVLAGDPPTCSDLVDFALTETYCDLRAELGIALGSSGPRVVVG
jgi:CheY-like chemotaxis protein/tetratricopeptide (TPR) repeat protein